MIHREKGRGRSEVQGVTHDLEDVSANRDPPQLPGNERRPVRAARASGLFDECAKERHDLRIAQSRGAQLVAPVDHRFVQRQSRDVALPSKHADQGAREPGPCAHTKIAEAEG